MNFDWTPKEKEFKSAVASSLGADSLPDLQSLEESDVPEIRTITLKYLRKLAQVGYLSRGTGPEGRVETLALMAGQEELAKAFEFTLSGGRNDGSTLRWARQKRCTESGVETHAPPAGKR